MEQATLFALPRWLEEEVAPLGRTRILGVDEAGRGPLAGPVVAAAVLLPPSPSDALLDLDDSKRLSELQRQTLFRAIHKEALAIGVGMVCAPEIDRLNILQSTFQAMRIAMDRALQQLPAPPDMILLDGKLTFVYERPLQAVIKGDQKSRNIAAASIIAKVTRDALMEAYHLLYPCYGFHEHKGYPSPAHRAALVEHGPCPIHRFSFRGVLPVPPPEMSEPSDEADDDAPLFSDLLEIRPL